MINKENLINDLKKLHKKIVLVYKDIFEYKYLNDSNFQAVIIEEYKNNNKIEESEKRAWNESYLHRSAYTLLNKILFIRICEDKGFMLNDEDKVLGEEVNPNAGQKLSMIGLQKWSDLISNYSLSELIRFSFKDMNRSYNKISLYKEDIYDLLIPNKNEIDLYFSQEDNKDAPFNEFELLLRNIIETLDVSRYNFDNSSDNVLGDVYEKFMDRDTRKALGQFYTPDFVIKYILKNTISELDVTEKPFVKILDPSCGSGHFLIMAYDLLKAKFLENLLVIREKFKKENYLISKGNENYYISGEEYWTEEYLHYHILKNCLYGADIDGFALQITTINLLLKDLEHFITDELNLIECDSLVRWEEDYDWKSLKDKLITGDLFLDVTYRDINGEEQIMHPSFNQAYNIVEKAEFWSQSYDYIIGNPPYGVKFSKREKDYIKNRYSCVYKEYESYVFFYELAINTCAENGMVAFITPNNFISNVKFKKLRKFILDNSQINVIADLKSNVFDDVAADTAILILSKGNSDDENINLFSYNGGAFELESRVTTRDIENNFEYRFDFKNEGGGIISKIEHQTIRLQKLVDISRGVEFGLSSDLVKHENQNGDLYPIVSNRHITHFDIRPEEYFLKHIDDTKIYKDFSIYTEPRILVRRIAKGIISAYEDRELLNVCDVYNLLPKETNLDLRVISAILNSDVINYYYIRKMDTSKKLFPKVPIAYLKKLPIKYPNKIISDKLKAIVSNIISLNRRIVKQQNAVLYSKKPILDYINLIREGNELKIFSLIEELNEIIYNLYNLDEGEKREIKGFLSKDFSTTEDEVSFLNNFDEFSQIHITDNKSILDISKEFNIHPQIVFNKREEFSHSLESEMWRVYNLSELYTLIGKFINKEANKIINDEEKYINSSKLIAILNKQVSNFKNLISAMKVENPTQKTSSIVKQIVNRESGTFNSYITKRKENKAVKKLVKYDTEIYGLSKWSDEIHRKYFVDVINYSTSLSDEDYKGTVFEGLRKTEKRAVSALSALKELDFKDKEEYLEILTDKVKKAFD